MHARLNFIFCEKGQLDDGVAHIERADRAAVEALDGSAGLTTLVDDEAQVIVALSYWQELLRSSEATLTEAREVAAKAAGGNLVTETLEVAVDWRAMSPGGVTAMRMARLQIELARLADLIGFYEDVVTRELATCEEILEWQLLIDRTSGNCVWLTGWASSVVPADADEVLARLRQEAAERLGAKFSRVEIYRVVRKTAPTG